MELRNLFSNISFENICSFYFENVEDLNKTESINALSALANSQGGYLFFGVSKNDEVFGLDLGTLPELRRSLETINSTMLNRPVLYGVSMKGVDSYAERFVFCVAIQKSPERVLLKTNEASGFYYCFDAGVITLKSPNDVQTEADSRFNSALWSSFLSSAAGLPKDESALVETLKFNGLLDADGSPMPGFEAFGDLYEGALTRIVFRDNRTSKNEDSRLFEGSFFASLNSCLSFLSATFDNLRVFYPVDAIRQAILICYQLRDYSKNENPILVEMNGRSLSISCDSFAYRLIDGIKNKSFVNDEINENVAKCIRLIYGEAYNVSDLLERKTNSCSLKVESGKMTFLFGSSSEQVTPICPRESQKTLAKHEEEKQRVLEALKQGPLTVLKLQTFSSYGSRAYFLKKVINPLAEEGLIEKVGDKYSPVCVYRIKKA